MRNLIKHIFENNLSCPVENVILAPEAITIILSDEVFANILMRFDLKHYLMSFGLPIETVSIKDRMIDLYISTWDNNTVEHIISSIAKDWHPASNFNTIFSGNDITSKLELKDVFIKSYPKRFVYLWDKDTFALNLCLMFLDGDDCKEFQSYTKDFRIIENDKTGLISKFWKALKYSIFSRMEKSSNGVIDITINTPVINSFLFVITSDDIKSNSKIFIENNVIDTKVSRYTIIDNSDKCSFNNFMNFWKSDLFKFFFRS